MEILSKMMDAQIVIQMLDTHALVLLLNLVLLFVEMDWLLALKLAITDILLWKMLGVTQLAMEQCLDIPVLQEVHLLHPHVQEGVEVGVHVCVEMESLNVQSNVTITTHSMEMGAALHVILSQDLFA